MHLKTQFTSDFLPKGGGLGIEKILLFYKIMKPTDTFDHMLRDPEFHNKELQCNNCLFILFIVWCKVHQSAFENNFCIKVDQCNPRPHGSSCQRRQEPAQRRPTSRFLVLGARISTLISGRLVVRTCMVNLSGSI